MFPLLLRTLRRFRSIPTGATPPPPAPAYDTSLPRSDRLVPPMPVIALLAARPGVDVAGLALHLARAITAHGGRPALLWSERTDALDETVVTTATSAALFPDTLQSAAGEFPVARIAHLGAKGEAKAAACLFEDLQGSTHAVLDGRLLGAVKAHLGVFVVGDGMGDDPPMVKRLRDCCDVEVNEASFAVAEALLRALDRRA
ncbi:MAG: hypothetical protein U0326_25975 [Polyangiales bacterium]